MSGGRKVNLKEQFSKGKKKILKERISNNQPRPVYNGYSFDPKIVVVVGI